MEQGLVTVDDVVRAVDQDPELETAAEKCDVYRRLVEWGRGPSREDYPRLGAEGCADHPLPESKPD